MTPAVGQSKSAGWVNLASAPTYNPTARGFNSGLSSTPPAPGVTASNITSLWAWDAPLSKWYFYAPNLEAQGGTALTDYITSKNYLDFGTKTLDPTMGFWVNTP